MPMYITSNPLIAGSVTENDNILIADVEESLRRLYRQKVRSPHDDDLEGFVQANSHHITFVLNVWIRMMKDDGFDRELQYVLRNSSDAMDIFRCVTDLASGLVMCGDPNVLSSTLPSDPNKLYACYRFLMRTALDSAPWLEDEALSTLVRAMKYNRNWSPSPDHLTSSELDWKYRSFWFCQEVLPILREEMHNVFGEDLLNEDFDPRDQSSGAVQDACTNAFCKYLRATLPWKAPDLGASAKEGGNGLGTFMTSYPHYSWITMGDHLRKVVQTDVTPVYIVTPIAVPKTYKAARIVAPESACMIYKQKHFSDQLRARWKKLFPLEMVYDDQDESRLLASQVGYATADQTSASDCIRRSFLKDTMYIPLLNQLLSVMPTHIRIRKRVMRMQMAGTMGSPLTFDFLSGTSLALARSACRLANIFDGYGDYVDRPVSQKMRKRVKAQIRIVGDDIVLPDWAYPFLLLIMEAVSLIPNESKSFSCDHRFREACGFEGFDHVNADVLYVPRGVIFDPRNTKSVTFDNWKGAWKDPLSSLISLRNRLMDAIGEGSQCVQYMTQELRNWVGEFHPDYVAELPNSIHSRFGPYKVQPMTGSAFSKRVGVWHENEYGDLSYYSTNIGLCVSDAYRRDTFGRLRKEDRLVVSVTKVVWIDTSPKASCICNLLPKEFVSAMKDLFDYESFLKYGPVYEDRWCELAHASTPRRYSETYRKRPRIVLGDQLI